MEREDLISRGDLFNELATVQAADANEMKGKIYSIIQAMPTADRPQGENLSEEYPSLFECSVCGASCFDTIPWDCNINFCPSCGCRMKGASDD